MSRCKPLALSALLLPAVLLPLAEAQAGDDTSVTRVEAGIAGDQAVLHAVTTSARRAPAGVELMLSPMPGSPDLAARTLDPTPAGPPEAVWRVEGLQFEGDAHAGRYPVEVSLWGADARPLATVHLTVAAADTPCAEPAATWGDSGQARARMRLSPDGTAASMELALTAAGPDQVSGVRVRFLKGGAEGPKAPRAPAWATLAEVQQRWTATVPVETAGHAYQVDAFARTAAGDPTGFAFASAVTLDGPAPVAAAMCPWPDARVATLADDGPSLALR
ncbi:MAG: hypothetical protein H6742_10065 [Alphaproteobacteria bacterium]|nr:hypothetical protein [Alphaproteobacteria bacterium]